MMIQLLILHTALIFQPRTYEGTKPQSNHQLNINFQAAEVLNDDLKFTYKTIQPALHYRYQTERGFRFSTLIGALYNRIDLSQAFSPEWALMTGLETRILIAGDTPRINGVELNQYKFEAHRFPVYIGAQYSLNQYQLQARLLYEFEAWQIYDEARNSTFTPPNLGFEHGPLLRLHWGQSGGPEISDSGSRALALVSWRYRPGMKEWGENSHLKNISQYWKGSVGGTSYFSICSHADLVVRAQASGVHRADRLNAIGINYGQEVSAFGLDDEKTDRAASGETGVRVYFNEQKNVAVKPFGFAVGYREVLPAGTRKNFGAGPGLKIMGKIDPSFSWDAQYSLLMGTRDDNKALHHMKLSASYRFF